MPNHVRVAKCPYYERENRIAIFCEGCVVGSDGFYAHIFITEGEKRQYFARHCTHYPSMNCIYAKHMNELYERGILDGKAREQEKAEGKEIKE